MHIYNPNIHHRRSIRLQGYDYSQAGLYFITICCRDRIHHSGNVVKGEMILNENGRVAYDEWMKTPEIRTNVELGEFIIMPNHMHGIILIYDRGELISPEMIIESQPPDLGCGVCNMPQRSSFRSPSQTVGAIVRGYKSSVTKQLVLLGLVEKLWQRNYYEHIIRNEQSFQNITNYIRNNPAKWVDNKF